MSFNGSGTFLINTTGQPVVPNTVISASAFNTLTADLANGLTNCITKDGQTTITANIPMNSFKFTGLAAGSVGSDSANLSQIQSGAASVVTVSGTNAYTGVMSPTIIAYAAGNTFTFVVPNTNTTSCTLNIDGLGAKALTRDGSTALISGDLVAGSEIIVVYDGTQFQVLNSNSKTTFKVSGTLTAGALSGPHNGTVGATTPSTGAFTTLTASGAVTLSGGTANGIVYLNASKVLTSGSALTFSGTNFATTGTATAAKFIPSGGTATGNGMYLATTNTLAWSTNGVETMRLGSTGNFSLGTTFNGWSSQRKVLQMGGASVNSIALNGAPGGGEIFFNSYLNASTEYAYANAGYAGSFDFGISAVGGFVWNVAGYGAADTTFAFEPAMTLDQSRNLTVPATYSTTVTTPRNMYVDSTGKFGGISSSRVSKTNIEFLDDVSWLYQLQPVTFNYRKRDERGAYLDEHETEKQFGMIAEDAAPVAPDLCIYDADGKPIGIHYDRLIPVLLKELQKQAERIAILEAK